MTEFQIKNAAHREFIEQLGNFDIAESLGLAVCGVCSGYGVLTLVDSETRTYHFHHYTGSTLCTTVPVCDECYQQGACGPDSEECLDMMEDDHYCRGCIRDCTDPGCLAMVTEAMVRRTLPDRAFGYESYPSIYNLPIPPEKDSASARTGQPLGTFHVFATAEERDHWVAGPWHTINQGSIKYFNRIAVEPSQALPYVSTSDILEV